MSSYFDDASLVMIPSGYKTSKVYSVKPTSGDGDLTFTRSNDTATRVASNGLIEKVRTNVLLQSNSFNTTWIATSSTITSGATDPNGGTTAWTLSKTASGTFHLYQNTSSLTGIYNFSIYAKAGTNNEIRIDFNNTQWVQVNLITGGVVSTGGLISNKRTDIGGGWWRIEIAASITSNSLVRIGHGGSGATGTLIIWNSQLETGDIATDYIATTTAAVSVGPVANVPRLDYLNSSCPKLILEPQRTNVVLFSESIDNAAWTKDGSTTTANQTTSPSGYVDADLITNNGGAADHSVYQQYALSASTAYSVSAYVKKGTEQYVFFALNYGANSNEWATATFNLDAGTSGNYSSVLSAPTSTITSVGNDWYRVTMTATTATSGTHILIIGFGKAGAPDTARGRYIANNTNTFYLWGCQLEQGAYATSYIPTLGAAVTRGADDADTTFASAFATDGGATWFLEFDGNTIPQVNQTGANFALNFASGDYLGYNHNASPEHRFRVQASGVGYFAAASGLNANSPAKLAVSVTASSYTAYANGVQINTASIVGNWASATNLITFINDSFGSLGVKQMIFFPTALSNAQLTELTA